MMTVDHSFIGQMAFGQMIRNRHSAGMLELLLSVSPVESQERTGKSKTYEY